MFMAGLTILLGSHNQTQANDNLIDSIYREIGMNPILSKNDREIYKRFFSGINQPRGKNFDKDLAQLQNKLLVPSILFARYTSAQNASFDQLVKFMSHYPDYPDSVVIYKLAQKKQPKNNKTPIPAPVRAFLAPEILIDFRPDYTPNGQEEGLSENNNVRRVQGLLKEKNYNQALVFARSMVGRVKPENIGEIYGEIISRFYRDGHYLSARDFAIESFKFAPLHSMVASWWAGLAEWQLGDYQGALKFFEQTTLSDDKWLSAAASFWGARCLTQLEEFERVKDYYWTAYQTAPLSFYGQLAQEILGIEGQKEQVITPQYNRDILEKMVKNPTTARLFALMELGEYAIIDKEIRPLKGRLTAESAENLLYFTSRLNIPHTSLKLAEHLERISAKIFLESLYPQRNNIDLNSTIAPLVHGVMRQESAFASDAKSTAGALGLMQLMPGTAKDVSGKKLKTAEILDSKTNINLGTKYLYQLLNLKDVNGNIFYSLAGYNAGIGNVRKWFDKMPDSTDPLVYIESIPIRETRIYLERVMANYWVYSGLFNADLSSRRDIAEGKMPHMFTQQTKNDANK